MTVKRWTSETGASVVDGADYDALAARLAEAVAALELAADSIGRFTSDEGSTQHDFEILDTVLACLPNKPADSAPAALPLWKPYRIGGAWPYWQCATPTGPYNFQAETEEAAQAVCDRERAAHSAEVVHE